LPGRPVSSKKCKLRKKKMGRLAAALLLKTGGVNSKGSTTEKLCRCGETGLGKRGSRSDTTPLKPEKGKVYKK